MLEPHFAAGDLFSTIFGLTALQIQNSPLGLRSRLGAGRAHCLAWYGAQKNLEVALSVPPTVCDFIRPAENVRDKFSECRC